jgi:predicted DsbA family dithiol-disulfide isomerase
MSSAGDEPVRVRVDYDFASSLCYVAHRCMQRLAGEIAELGIELAWSPVDLTLLTGWKRGAEVDEARRHNVERVSRDLDVPLVMPRIWLDSRPAHAVALCLDPRREPTWREAVFSTVFEAGSWPTEENVRDLAEGLGLLPEPEALHRAADELFERTRRAHAQEVTGVPNFMLGRWPFGGIQTDDTMLSILGRFAARQRERAAQSDPREDAP